ncbi:PGF-pre-PGF domain-containing protein [Candidatus Pacearchaeota archaeon]|nr:PGF-pre-PGF domain-containing protein [Candidatus Pacearchaeota archaeon]
MKMNFDTRGLMKSNAFHLALILVFAVAIVFVMNFTDAYGKTTATVNITNQSGTNGPVYLTINEDVQYIYNLTINHTSEGGPSNLTQVNVSLWTDSNFTIKSNRTGNISDTRFGPDYSCDVCIYFSNISSTLTWNATNLTSVVVYTNATITSATVTSKNYSFFTFNATAWTPGLFNLTIRFQHNKSAFYNETNISIKVNDTTAPYEINITNTSKGRIWANGNYSGSVDFNASVLDNYLTGAGISTIGVRVFINITNSSGQQNATITLSNVSGNYWNATINTKQYPDGIYNISVWVNDTSNNLNSSASSSNVTFDNTKPTASAVCSPSQVNTGNTVTCTCSPSDTLSGVNSSATSITANPSTVNTGTFTESCSFADKAGNTASTTAQYTVEQSGTGTTTTSGATSSVQVPVTQTETASTEKSHTFAKITPGAAAIKSDFNTDAGVKEISIEVNNEAQNVEITVTKHDGKPAAVSVAREGSVYKYLQIEATNLDGKLDKATVKVQVEKSWVSSNVEDKDDVAVFKFDDDSELWNELTTTYDSEDDTYYYYTSEVSSFSYFAIGEKVVEAAEEEVTTTTPISEKSSKLLWIVIAIILLAVIIGGGIAWKKKKGQQ